MSEEQPSTTQSARSLPAGDSESEADFLCKRTKYESLLDGGMTVSIPATLCAATALDLLANKALYVKDTNGTGIVYVILLSLIGIFSLFNVALSMLLHYHAKLIFSSSDLPGPMLQCREFEDLWKMFSQPRRSSREGFIFSMPAFLFAMAWRPGLWKKPSIFSYISFVVFLIAAIVVFYWLWRINHYWSTRSEFLDKMRGTEAADGLSKTGDYAEDVAGELSGTSERALPDSHIALRGTGSSAGLGSHVA